MKNSANRLYLIDLLRGITLISMILYHFMWDLVYFADIKAPWYDDTPGEIWQKSICMSFILISGFCFPLGKKHLLRSLEIFIGGVIVSAVTIILMPENRILFGILTFMGTAGLLMIPVNRIFEKIYKDSPKRLLSGLMIFINFVLFIMFYQVDRGYLNLICRKINVPVSFYKGYLTAYLGFPDYSFYSADYFSILPWIFLYFIGYFLFRLLSHFEAGEEKKLILNDGLRRGLSIKPKTFFGRAIEAIGRNTLLIYMLHQPVLYGLTLLIIRIKK